MGDRERLQTGTEAQFESSKIQLFSLDNLFLTTEDVYRYLSVLEKLKEYAKE